MCTTEAVALDFVANKDLFNFCTIFNKIKHNCKSELCTTQVLSYPNFLQENFIAQVQNTDVVIF